MKKIIRFLILIQVLSLSISCNSVFVTNYDPESPGIPTITGPATGEVGKQYFYNITSSDPQNDEIYFIIRCSDCPAVFNSNWIESGDTIIFNHCWCCFYQKSNPFTILAMAIDSKGYESDWCKFKVNITNIDDKSHSFLLVNQIFNMFLYRFVSKFFILAPSFVYLYSSNQFNKKVSVLV